MSLFEKPTGPAGLVEDATAVELAPGRFGTISQIVGDQRSDTTLSAARPSLHSEGAERTREVQSSCFGILSIALSPTIELGTCAFFSAPSESATGREAVPRRLPPTDRETTRAHGTNL